MHPSETVVLVMPESRCRQCGAKRHPRPSYVHAEPAETWRDVVASFSVLMALVVALYVVVLAAGAYALMVNVPPPVAP